MFYKLYEINHAAIQPYRAIADATRLLYTNPLNPVSGTPVGRSIAAMAEVFERTTRRYAKPEFGIEETEVDGKPVPVCEKTVWSRPFCRLLHFERALPEHRQGERVLLVAPMSGHYATLLRGTVQALLPHADIYITDWADARTVPVSEGRFGLEDYVDYVIEMLHALGEGTHVIAVCQPAVPVLAAVSVMERRGDPFAPASMTLMGGPIDTRINPTAVNRFAKQKGIDWFRRNVITQVPWPHPGFLRRVYPGFLQLSGFLGMNLERHINAHKEFYLRLVADDGDSAEKHREFYDEYLAVMDMTAEFYLETVERVFIEHDLPRGQLIHRGETVDPSAIRNVALLTVEGGRDDISGIGQTEAAHRLCSSLPAAMRRHHLQPDVGHYGVFNGSRFRADIVPVILSFMQEHSHRQKAAAGGRKRAR